jgi:hypothetical protein
MRNISRPSSRSSSPIAGEWDTPNNQNEKAKEFSEELIFLVKSNMNPTAKERITK